MKLNKLEKKIFERIYKHSKLPTIKRDYSKRGYQTIKMYQGYRLSKK